MLRIPSYSKNDLQGFFTYFIEQSQFQLSIELKPLKGRFQRLASDIYLVKVKRTFSQQRRFLSQDKNLFFQSEEFILNMKIVLNELIKCILITSFVVFQALSFLMTLTMYCMLCNFPDVVFRFLIYELYELQWLKMMLCKTNKLHCCRKKDAIHWPNAYLARTTHAIMYSK